MLPLYRLLSLRYFRQRWDRTTLIVASIALGVATLVSTRMLNQCIDAAARQRSGLAVPSDVRFLITTGESGVRNELVGEVAAVPGVRSARPWLFQQLQITDLDNRAARLIGVELGDKDFLTENPYGVKVTFLFENFTVKGFPSIWDLVRRQAFISRDIYEERRQRGIPDDAPMKVRVGGREVNLVPVAIIELEGMAAEFSRSVVAMEINLAAGAVGRPGLYSRIDVALADGADPNAVREGLDRVVGERAQVRVPEAQGQETQEVISGVQIAFQLCGAGALVVGLFLVYNAMAVSVAERRHDIGVMRSLGATRTQVALLFAGEAVLLGLVGSLLGVPLGVGLADMALKEIDPELARVFASDGVSVARLSTATLLIAVLSGAGTALGAALVPAVQAANDQPADAVRRVPSAQAGYFRYLQGAVCLILVAGGYAAYLLREDLPGKWGIYSCPVLMLLGMLMGLPMVVGVVARVFQPIARLLFGVEARLAADNLVRAPGRTGVVIGALAAGVGLMYLIAGVGRSNEAPILDWIDRFATADLYVFHGDLASAGASTMPMDEAVGAGLRRLPEVKQVVGVRYSRPTYNQKAEVFLIGLDAQAYYDTNRKTSKLPGLDLFPRLREPGTVLVSDNFAAKHHVAPGETIGLPGPNGTVRLKVLGTIQDYSWAQGTLIMDRERYAEAFSDRLVDIYDVFLRDDLPPEQADAAVRQFAQRGGLSVINQDALKDYVREVIDRLYRIAYLQQVVVGIVAALGVVMALLISILQRRRELGTLRAVGATQGQVLKSVLAEAMLMGLVGTVLGMFVGLPLEWYILRVVVFEESGFLFPVIIPWMPALGIGAIAVALAALAGLGPALHAVRINIAEAIAYE